MRFMGVSQNQPKGGGRPSLFTGDYKSISDHVAAAIGINPAATLINAALRPEIRRVIHTRASAPERANSHRDAAAEYISALGKTLEPAREQWVKSIPGGAPGRHLHFPLIHF